MNCEKLRQQMMDFVYGEGPEPPGSIGHFDSCWECSAFYQRLLQTQESLGELKVQETDYGEVQTVVRKARDALERSQLVWNLIKFVAIVGGIITLFVLLYC